MVDSVSMATSKSSAKGVSVGFFKVAVAVTIQVIFKNISVQFGKVRSTGQKVVFRDERSGQDTSPKG